MRRFLYLEFWWTVHNMIAHPLMQVVWWLSLFGYFKSIANLSDWLHDVTCPQHNFADGNKPQPQH
jgi:hypothetical protein